jgi:hypothetical protein
MNESYQSEFNGDPQREVLGMPFASNQRFDLRTKNKLGSLSDPLLQAPRTAEPYMHQASDGNVFPVAITSWQQFSFNGRPAELALSRKG